MLNDYNSEENGWERRERRKYEEGESAMNVDMFKRIKAVNNNFPQ